MEVDPKIFKAYDIRGVVPTEVNAEVAEKIGKAFGTFAFVRYGRRVVVGCDNRPSSKELKEAFIFGLMSCGCKVYDSGLSLTPIIQFLTFNKQYDFGVMVTASHNPKEFNGFRLVGKKSDPIFGDLLQEVRKIIETEAFRVGKGDVSYEVSAQPYEEFLTKSFKFTNPIKVLIDCGNGTPGIIAPKIMQDLGTHVEALNCDLTSSYPYDVPDPENTLFMEKVAGEVTKAGFDVGFAYDTDADRFGVVDELGITYSNDKIFLLFIKHAFKKVKKGKVLYDVKSSYLVEDVAKENGGEAELIRTGHPYFIEGIKKGALLGAEFSGHTFFGDRYLGFDDGIYASLRVLEIMDKEGKKLSELMAEFPKTFHTTELKVDIPESEKATEMAQIRSKLASSPHIVRKVEIDGIRGYFDPQAWFLIRPSNTTPHLSLRFESAKQGGIEAMVEFVQSLSNRFKDLAPSIHFS